MLIVVRTPPPEIVLCVYYTLFFADGNAKKYEFFDNNMKFHEFSV